MVFGPEILHESSFAFTSVSSEMVAALRHDASQNQLYGLLAFS